MVASLKTVASIDTLKDLIDRLLKQKGQAYENESKSLVHLFVEY